jgi:hypothetical protein
MTDMNKNRVTQYFQLLQEAEEKGDEDKIQELKLDLLREFDIRLKNGGRIGFQTGRRVLPVEIPTPADEMSQTIKRLMEEGGLSREAAEKEAEIILFGPSAMKLRDSKNGIASVIASADDDIKDPSDMLTDDAMDMFKTDETELLMELLKSGQMAKLDDDELRRMYDSMVESEAGIRLLDEFNINSFEDYKSLIESTKRPEGIMQTMVA